MGNINSHKVVRKFDIKSPLVYGFFIGCGVTIFVTITLFLFHYIALALFIYILLGVSATIIVVSAALLVDHLIQKLISCCHNHNLTKLDMVKKEIIFPPTPTFSKKSPNENDKIVERIIESDKEKTPELSKSLSKEWDKIEKSSKKSDNIESDFEKVVLNEIIKEQK